MYYRSYDHLVKRLLWIFGILFLIPFCFFFIVLFLEKDFTFFHPFYLFLFLSVFLFSLFIFQRIVSSLVITPLKREAAEDHAFFSSIGEGVIATNARGDIIFLNQVAKKFLGLHKSDLYRPITDVFSFQKTEDGSVVSIGNHPAIKTLASGKRISTTAYCVAKTSATCFPVAVTSAPVMQGDQLLGAIVILRDIRKEKEVERLKTEFVSLASHQLQAPLASLKWYGELLARGETGPLRGKKRQYVERMNIATKHMISLVDGFLNVSRFESGRLLSRRENVDLVELIKQIKKLFLQEIRSKKLHYTLLFDEQIPLVFIDMAMIREVCVNLISNAIIYTPKEGRVTISLEKKKNILIFSVEDTGYGIPKKDQPYIFDKFFRADNILEKPIPKGSGLGLYMVKEFVGRLHGSISFTSQEGKGTTFWVKIPLHKKKVS